MSDDKSEKFVEDEVLGTVFVPEGTDSTEIIEEAREAAAQPAVFHPRVDEDVDILERVNADRPPTRIITDGVVHAANDDLSAPVIEYEPIPIEEQSGQASLQSELQKTLNKWSAENGSGTPDYILAEYLLGCLNSYNKAVRRRAQHNGYQVDGYGHEFNTENTGAH